jgi:hypothetical protein
MRGASSSTVFWKLSDDCTILKLTQQVARSDMEERFEAYLKILFT